MREAVRIPGTTRTIDALLVGAGGVVVAATETCAGRVRTDGLHLRVRGRDRSDLIDVSLWQTETVRGMLAQQGLGAVPVQGVVRWAHAEALGRRDIELRGVRVLEHEAALGLAGEGPVPAELQARVLRALACLPDGG